MFKLGVDHHNAKLDPEKVKLARCAFRAQGASIRSLANRFGVHHKTMKNALEGYTWKSAGGPLT